METIEQGHQIRLKPVDHHVPPIECRGHGAVIRVETVRLRDLPGHLLWRDLVIARGFVDHVVVGLVLDLPGVEQRRRPVARERRVEVRAIVAAFLRQAELGLLARPRPGRRVQLRKQEVACADGEDHAGRPR